jgi:hypothetical protein
VHNVDNPCTIIYNILDGGDIINVYECLSNKFNADEPILVEDIESMFPERSRPWIDKSN